jgi:hypothetical protein
MKFPRLPKPDSRATFSLGLFALTVLVLVMLDHNPRLASVPLFATIAQALVITGLINLAASFYFGASKPPDPPHMAPPPTDPGDPK